MPSDDTTESAEAQKPHDHPRILPTSTASFAESQLRHAQDGRAGKPNWTAGDGRRASHTPTSPRGFGQIVQLSRDFDDDPDAAKAWLIKFGSLKSGTDVSQDLRAVGVDRFDALENPVKQYQSLLPTLTQWLKISYDKAVSARREQKTSGNRTAGQREQTHFDWLCCYVQDYLGLAHPGLSPQELAQLSTCMLDICDITSEARDIEHALNIIYAILIQWPFPADVLDQTLQVLCKVQVYFNRHTLPEHLVDCARLLLEGNLRGEVTNKVFSLGKLSKSNTEAVRLRVARGSLLLMRPMLRLQSSAGSFILEFDRLIETLWVAAQCRVITLSTDVLGVCNDLLNEKERLRNTLSHDWNTFIEVIGTSAEPFSCEESSSGGRGSLQPSARERADAPSVDQKSSHNHQEATRQLNETLRGLLPKMMDSKSNLVYEYLLRYPSSLSPPQSITTLQFVDDKRLCWPQNRNWRAEINRLVAAFVTDMSHTSEVRCRAIEVIGTVGTQQVAAGAEATPMEQHDEIEMATGFAFDILLAHIKAEKDPVVLQQLAFAIERLATTQARLLRVTEHFRPMTMAPEAEDDTSEGRVYVITRSMIKMFLRSLHEMEDVASATFDALAEITTPRCKSRKARVSAMILLFHLRCDSDGFVYVQVERESEYIAAALCRTAESAESVGLDTSVGQGASASSASLASISKSSPPLWQYPELEPLPHSVQYSSRSTTVRGRPNQTTETTTGLDVGLWLLNLIQCLQGDIEWETYSFVIVHLGAQLSNTQLFTGSLSTIVKLRQVLSEQISNNSFREPPVASGLKKSDVAICIFNILTPLIAFATMKSESIQKGFGDDLVRAFLSGVGGLWEGTSRGCIHALSICSLELPGSVASAYPAIVDKLSKNMTQPHLAMHILEFLAQVARLPQVHSNFREEEITMIFGICIQFLEKTREQQNPTITSPPGRIGTPSRYSGVNFRRPPYRAAMIQDIGMPQYASALAYHTMIFWFLSLKLDIRSRYVSWIVPRLVWKNAKGEEVVDEQSQVFIDMMQRTAFSDLGETMPRADFAKESDGPLLSASWIVGLSIVTIEAAGHTGVTQITKRQASGTTYAKYQQITADLPSHHAPSNTEIRSGEANLYSTEMLPAHVLLQRVSSAAPTSIDDQPLPLPGDDIVTRALAMFDRIPTVDSHKIGVLYIGPIQKSESEYLSNTKGSQAYSAFLSGLGYAVSLKPPVRFNPQGLQYPQDGDTTIAWRDRVSEIVYHVPTLMPSNAEDDPQCVGKKAHVGNCHVNMIFNDSGLAWDFDNFKSQLNYVNIVITPASRPSNFSDGATADDDSGSRPSPAFYLVHLLTKEGFPKISPAADPKVISAAQLPHFTRMVALNANLFCQAWNAKDNGDKEFPSNWRARLQQVKRLKERVLARREQGNSGAAPVNVPSSSSAQRSRTPVPTPPGSRVGDRDREPAAQGFDTDGQLALQLDFSKWTL